MAKRITRSSSITSPNKIHEFKPGSYVWAKMDRKFWPGIIVSHRDIGMDAVETGRCWVFWFGDHRVSKITCKLLKDFCQEYFTYIKISGMYCRKWIQGVSECLREIGLPDTEAMSIQNLKLWANSNIKNAYIAKYFVTDFVKSKLDKLRVQNLKPATDEYNAFIVDPIRDDKSKMEIADVPANVSENVKKCANHKTRQIIAKYNMGNVSTLRICMGCYSDKISDEHPIFIGYFCTECNKRFKRTYCNLKSIKKDYCTVCGFTGEMLVCMNRDCRYVYCTICLEDLAEEDAYTILSRKKKWFCFLCALNKDCRGALIPRDGWEENDYVIMPEQMQGLSSSNNNKRKNEEIKAANLKLILSTLDILKNKSGFHYSGNSNECIEITESNYPEMMQLLISRKGPNENIFKNGMPVNVLICNQRSSNDNNQRTYPTSVMCEFYQLVKYLNKVQENTCNWIFEWGNNMDLQQCVTVTKFLKKYPLLYSKERRVWSSFPLDTENIALSFRNILFSEPSCYKEQPNISNMDSDIIT